MKNYGIYTRSILFKRNSPLSHMLPGWHTEYVSFKWGAILIYSILFCSTLENTQWERHNCKEKMNKRYKYKEKKTNEKTRNQKRRKKEENNKWTQNNKLHNVNT